MEPAGAAPRSTFSRFGIHQPVHVIPGGLNSGRKAESPGRQWTNLACASGPQRARKLFGRHEQPHRLRPSGSPNRATKRRVRGRKQGQPSTGHFPHPPLPPSPRILLFSTSVGRFLERHAPRTVNEARRPRSECGRRGPPAPTLRTGSGSERGSVGGREIPIVNRAPCTLRAKVLNC